MARFLAATRRFGMATGIPEPPAAPAAIGFAIIVVATAARRSAARARAAIVIVIARA